MATRKKKTGARKTKTSKASRSRTGKKKDAGSHDLGFDPAMMDQWQKAMTPGTGHEKLEPLVGTFEAKSKMWMAPGTPPTEGSGTSKHRWVLGGRYVEQVYRGKTMGMPFQGIGYTGFDNAAKKYIGTWMDSMGTGIMTSESEGRATPKKMAFKSKVVDPMSGKEGHMRSVVRIKDRNHHTFEMWAKDPKGKEFRSLLVEYKRK